MANFYIRVFRDGERYRTLGTGSRGMNRDNYDKIIEGLISAAKRYQKDPKNYYGTVLGKKYRFEFINNRYGTKEMYREIEIELHIPPIMHGCQAHTCSVYLIECKDITYITDGYDPRVLKLPDNY